jgi:hypothetical protein
MRHLPRKELCMDTSPFADRFADTGDTKYSLMANEVLVECPRCGKCALHKPMTCDREQRDWFSPRRLVCAYCALSREWKGKAIYRRWLESPARDDYFGEILWIRGSFGAHEVWAYNWRHLELIQQYVAAKLRAHMRNPKFGWANKSFVNRLPKWIASAKNRSDVLATIDRIKQERHTSK